MAIRYEFLREDKFPQAHAAMVEAFSDYHLDMSYMTSERSRLRNLKSGVRYDCSVGAFDGEKMVGLTFVGLDDWQGEKAAFDAGTACTLTNLNSSLIIKLSPFCSASAFPTPHVLNATALGASNICLSVLPFGVFSTRKSIFK